MRVESMIYEKLTTRRSIRKYTQDKVSNEVLLKCVDAARLSPSAMNRQPLKYIIVDDKELLVKVFETLSWAGYLPEYKPNQNEMPTAYIIILLDRKIREKCGHDAGIAAMSISMVASEEGLGSCILGAIDRPKMREVLNVPDDFDILLCVSLGFPAESPIADEVEDHNIKYWLDRDGKLHVPKRDLKDIISWNGYSQ